MPPWFQEQVDRLSKPTLPDFDPEAALAGLDGTAAAPRRRSAQSSPTQSTGQTRTDAEAEQRDDHPLSDVWGDG
ncbi:MAG: hypothetical protein J07HN4v3_00823 [Halonotius sp. J07HN4]|nr:MAG: hypothetical protein J07HN4v3_00823 [Halonotius sp. J07HN4]